MAVILSVQEKYMREALKQAKKAYALGEVPIGCVIVHEGKIIGRGYNRRNTDKNTLSHAEITAINRASRVIGDWRLEECTLYVTLEPCQMCAGAIVQARIPEVVMGCMNPKAGCGGSILTGRKRRQKKKILLKPQKPISIKELICYNGLIQHLYN